MVTRPVEKRRSIELNCNEGGSGQMSENYFRESA